VIEILGARLKLLLGLFLIEVMGRVFIHNPLYNLFFSSNSKVGYVNLMIIKLLMMKLHAQDVYICILCWFCSIRWKMMLWLLNDGEIMIIWCRCCCMMMLSSIYAFGVDESIVVIELWWFCNFCENGLIMKKLILMMSNELRK